MVQDEKVKALIGIVEGDFFCHKCSRRVVLQLDLQNSPTAETPQDYTVCISYDCANCGSEYTDYR